MNAVYKSGYYDILHGFVDIDASSLFDTINCNVIRSRGYPLRIIKQHCNVNCRSSLFVCMCFFTISSHRWKLLSYKARINH